MAPHEAERYKIRSNAERVNGRLKEDFGANNVMVKGHPRVTQTPDVWSPVTSYHGDFVPGIGILRPEACIIGTFNPRIQWVDWSDPGRYPVDVE